jgi:gliding motility-associated protein GldC
MNPSTITIDVHLDENKVPETIYWRAPGTTQETTQKAKAMMLAFWDGADKTLLRIDLWTKDMMVDEMTDFIYQVMISMADSYERATNQKELGSDLKNFAKSFYHKFRDQQLKLNTNTETHI